MDKKSPAELLAELTATQPTGRITGPDQIERPAPRADRPEFYKIHDAAGNFADVTKSAAEAQKALREGWTIQTPEGKELARGLAPKEVLREIHTHGVAGGKSLEAQNEFQPEFLHDLRAEGVAPAHQAERQQAPERTPEALRKVLDHLPADQHEQARKDFNGLTTGSEARSHADALKIMAEHSPSFQRAKETADAQHEQENAPVTVQGAEFKSVLQAEPEALKALRAAGPKPPLQDSADGKVKGLFTELRESLAKLNEAKGPQHGNDERARAAQELERNKPSHGPSYGLS